MILTPSKPWACSERDGGLGEWAESFGNRLTSSSRSVEFAEPCFVGPVLGPQGRQEAPTQRAVLEQGSRDLGGLGKLELGLDPEGRAGSKRIWKKLLDLARKSTCCELGTCSCREGPPVCLGDLLC